MIQDVSPQGSSAAPAAAPHLQKNMMQRGFSSIFLSLCLCVPVATLIAIETHLRGSAWMKSGLSDLTR